MDYEGQSESTHDTEEDLSAEDLVDFSPVYRCLHIYTVLGKLLLWLRFSCIQAIFLDANSLYLLLVSVILLNLHLIGERDEFEKYYRKQRRQQASLTLQPPANMHESIDG